MIYREVYVKLSNLGFWIFYTIFSFFIDPLLMKESPNLSIAVFNESANA